MTIFRGALLALLLSAVSCHENIAPNTPPPAKPHAIATPKSEITWVPFDSDTFVRAKKEGKLVLLDGAAEWCHFCHVMDAVTYQDPAVQAILSEHYLIAKVDIDTRPDIQERYEAWGWPATILFSADGAELEKRRGYIEPVAMKALLEGALTKTSEYASPSADENDDWRKLPSDAAAIAHARGVAIKKLASLWDDTQKGWGREPKVPIGSTTEWALSYPKDSAQRIQALAILAAQRKIIDPVWGGIFQYSVAPDWDHPHYEKLMFFNAPALENYARAYAVTGDKKWLQDATNIRRYLEAFLMTPRGMFRATQDADLNAHNETKTFMKGEDYYAKSDSERRALGFPRIDPNEYADANGMAIAAYAGVYEVTHDESAKAIAIRAMQETWATHRRGDDRITHLPVANAAPEVYLYDHAYLGWGMLRLYEVTRDPILLTRTLSIVSGMLEQLSDEAHGGFFAHSVILNAAGVFRDRRRPMDENAVVARLFAHLLRTDGVPKELRAKIEVSYKAMIGGLLTDASVEGRGKFMGPLLLWLDELGLASPARK